MLWLNFILGLNFISLCFRLIIIHYYSPKLIIIHYHNQKQREMKFKPRIKLNHNIYLCQEVTIIFFSFENEKLVDTQISTTTKFVPVIVTNFNVGLIPRVE